MTEKPRPRLLFFYSPRSGACRRTESLLAEVLQWRRNHDTFDVTRVAVEAHPELVERLRIEKVPTFLVVGEGKVQARLVAPSGIREIRTFLGPWLRSASWARRVRVETPAAQPELAAAPAGLVVSR